MANWDIMEHRSINLAENNEAEYEQLWSIKTNSGTLWRTRLVLLPARKSIRYCILNAQHYAEQTEYAYSSHTLKAVRRFRYFSNRFFWAGSQSYGTDTWAVRVSYTFYIAVSRSAKMCTCIHAGALRRQRPLDFLGTWFLCNEKSRMYIFWCHAAFCIFRRSVKTAFHNPFCPSGSHHCFLYFRVFS